MALVQDIRTLNLGNGRVRQDFPDVSAQIRPATVSLTVADAAIVEPELRLRPALALQPYGKGGWRDDHPDPHHSRRGC